VTDEKMPQSVEAEQALLGAVLMNTAAFYLAAEHVDAECFAEPLHAKFWEMIQFRIDSGRTLDPVQFAISLGPDAEERIGDITVREYVARLAVNAVSVISASDYAKTIRELWKRRRLIGLAHQINYRAWEIAAESNVDELMEELDVEFSSLRFGTKAPGVVKMSEAVTSAIEMTARVYQGGAEPGIESRVPEIARLLGPLMPGDLVTLLAASGNGKTAMAGQLLTDAAAPLDGRESQSRA
jgi:replicative DNA helicase